MGNTIDTQMMVHRSTEFTKENSLQMHRTDVSQETFTKEMKLRAQQELQKPVGVENADGDIMIRTGREREGQEPARKKRRKGAAATRKEAEHDRPAASDPNSTFDVRI